MDELSRFLRQRDRVNASFRRREREQKRIWIGFSEEQKALEESVGKAYRRILNEISPIPVANWFLATHQNTGSAEVVDYRVEYTPQRTDNYFFMNVTKIKLPDGTFIDNNDSSTWNSCPHGFLESVCGALRGNEQELHPRILEFMKAYNIYHILPPHSNCKHQ